LRRLRGPWGAAIASRQGRLAKRVPKAARALVTRRVIAVSPVAAQRVWISELARVRDPVVTRVREAAPKGAPRERTPAEAQVALGPRLAVLAAAAVQ
jgi:hypothetical protein